MPRIADALERESRTVDLEQDGFERLLARRERKQRNRRIRAGAVAVIVALATAAALARSIAWERMPAVPPPVGAGEVLIGVRALGAQDPESGQARTIVDDEAIPARAEDITGAAWSPDRAWVAFRAGGLWVADTTGGRAHQLTADQGDDPWAWSPTEDRIAFVRGRDVTLFDAATGRQTDLGTVAADEDSEGYTVHSLVWSPDGTRIAYDGRPGSGSVYAIDVGTGEHTLLVPKPSGTGEIKDIDWSPDGAHLALSYLDASYIANHRAELGPIAYKAKALYLANADGSNVRLLDRVVASEWSVWIPGMSVGTGPSAGAVAWSPDGTRLAYTTFAGAEHRNIQVWTVSANGSDPSMVASRCCVADGGGPVWSPDGSQIAFETEAEGDTPHANLVVNADGTGDPTEIDELMYRSWAGGWFFCRCYG